MMILSLDIACVCFYFLFIHVNLTSMSERQKLHQDKQYSLQNFTENKTNIITNPARSYGILERSTVPAHIEANIVKFVIQIDLNTDYSFILSFYPNIYLNDLTLCNQFVYFVDDCFIYIDNIASYSGTINTTMTGKTCQRWDDIVPHVPAYTMGPEHANYCRAPDNDTQLWCMTIDPLIPWEYCNISECVTSTKEITTNEETTSETTMFNTMTTKTIPHTFVQTTDQSPPTTNIIYTTTNCSGSYICPCGSRAVYWMEFNQANLTHEEKLAILDEEKARLRKILIVDKTILTSYIRARTSAEDKRPSAKSIGLVGALMLIIVVVVIVLSDLMSCLPKLYNHFKNRQQT